MKHLRYTVEIHFRSWVDGIFKAVKPMIEEAKTIKEAKSYEELCDKSVCVFRITDNVNKIVVYYKEF